MTVPGSMTIACPSCRSVDLIANADGTLFCLSCRTDFNPAAMPIPAGDYPPPYAVPSVESVLGPPDVELAVCDVCGRSDPHDHPEEAPRSGELDADAFLERLVGTRVLLEGGAWATLVGFPDDDHASIMFDGDRRDSYVSHVLVDRLLESGVVVPEDYTYHTTDPHTAETAERQALEDYQAEEPDENILGAYVVEQNWPPPTVVEFNDILRHEPIPDALPGPDVEIDDETAWLVGDGVLTFACLIVEAGLASLEGVGREAQLIPSPTGFLPDDGDAIPLLEQGAAVAVAMICQAFDLPRDVIRASLDKIRPATREESTTEETAP